MLCLQDSISDLSDCEVEVEAFEDDSVYDSVHIKLPFDENRRLFAMFKERKNSSGRKSTVYNSDNESVESAKSWVDDDGKMRQQAAAGRMARESIDSGFYPYDRKAMGTRANDIAAVSVFFKQVRKVFKGSYDG